MFALRYAAVVAASLWGGGLLVLGAIAAPSIFDTLAARGVYEGRVLAGAIFGEALRRFHLLSYACGTLIGVSLVVRAALGPRPAPFGLRLAVLAVMLAAAVYSGTALTARIERARQAAGGAPSALAPDDPRRIAFGRLHGISTVLQVVPLVGSLALIFWELKDR
ncbi:MAG TPA: DUF4149 domain-containing protein [Vicinamibacterales bacterium]|nr:DUF4149 domain-containing protein [Vicinamibacterales bacterium]